MFCSYRDVLRHVQTVGPDFVKRIFGLQVLSLHPIKCYLRMPCELLHDRFRRHAKPGR